MAIDKENLRFDEGSYQDVDVRFRSFSAVQRNPETHGRMLRDSMDGIRHSMGKYGNQEYVFKVHLCKGISISYSRSIPANGMTVLFSPSVDVAVVSMSASAFDAMAGVLDEYIQTGKRKTRFQEIEVMEPNTGPEKVSESIQGKDGSLPVSVLMHPRFDGTRSEWSVPDYLSDAEDLRSYNLGSGFMTVEFNADRTVLSMLMDDPYVLRVGPIEICVLSS